MAYEKRMVLAPDWLEYFECKIGECPETCCQQWNIEVDPEHAARFKTLDDPELQERMNRTLRTFRLRRAGSRTAEICHRLMLTDAPGQKCPLLNEEGACSLQRMYGAGILCDTCYFHPRNFWQIDEETFLSADLSCPECARLCLLREEPLRFCRFSAEIDPAAEWLETELIPNPDTRELLRQRETRLNSFIRILQDRNSTIQERLCRVIASLEGLPEPPQPAAMSAADLLRQFCEVFDPVNESLEKPALGTASVLKSLAGGRAGYFETLASHFQEGIQICQPYLDTHPRLEENFLVHCLFSDGFKRFSCYQNDLLSPAAVCHHEAALWTSWFWLLRTLLAQEALTRGEMNDEIFLWTIIHADRLYWHYPEWFHRRADRLSSRTPAELCGIIAALS